ncbi:hypothetical protein F5Y08DRAFT_185061 [Xylaria arbuscula]|nr:hypothetical protein F5Y08DRAFT_185061 [Xylaria arbuscula]
MSSNDAYLRTGRGGAGNFYSRKDVEDIAKKDATEDIEAQKPPVEQDGNSTAPNTTLQAVSASSAAAATPAGDGATYLRSGRGGAGNFATTVHLPSTTTSTSTSASPPLSSHPSSASPGSKPLPSSPSSSSPSYTGGPRYSGRGGAGNYYDSGLESSEAAQRAKEEQEARRKEALDAGLAQEIRASLPQQPKRTYHLHEPGRGRRFEDDSADV